VQVRRVVFTGAAPDWLFLVQNAEVYNWDDEKLAGKNKTEYKLDRANYDRVDWRLKTNPMNNWVFPVVTGHKYKISWGMNGLDFEGMTMWMSEKWKPTDKSVILVHNHTDVRAEINVTLSSGV